jgi:hypothetical protein
MSQKGCAQTATPLAEWIAATASATVGVSRGASLDQVAADQRADVVDLLVPQARSVGRGGEHRFGQVRAPDRLPRRDAGRDLLLVQLKARLTQAGGHAQRTALAIGEELREGVLERGVGVVDQVAEDVQFARDGGPRIDGGDLDRGDDPHARALAREHRLGDAADGVVV